MSKFYRNWLITSVLLLVLTTLWHVVIFAAQYGVHLSGIARYVGGTPTPLFLYFIIAHIFAGFGFAMYVPLGARAKGGFVMNGVMMGIVTFAFFAVLSHALFAGWGSWLMGMDVSFGIISGGITGWVLGKLS